MCIQLARQSRISRLTLQGRHASVVPVAAITIPFLLLFVSPEASGESTLAARKDAREIQDLVNELRGHLSITEDVTVTIVERNAFLVSAEWAEDPDRGFLISFEEAFLDGLDEDELRAVIAHELGHVWIYTHHPYLQTERLANRIAMRVVTRESLMKVYGKVWARGGTKGDLAGFLGGY